MKPLAALAAAAVCLALAAPAVAQDIDVTNTEPAYEDNGRWFTSDDIPTYKIAEDGTVDFPTFSGFRRYNAECFQCHGPDGAGGSYAPALANSVMRIDYYQFFDTVVNGKQDIGAGQNRVMPAFGENRNVMCYLNDIYSYLRARGDGALDRGRPALHADKSDAFAEAEDACMG